MDKIVITIFLGSVVTSYTNRVRWANCASFSFANFLYPVVYMCQKL